MAFSKTAVLLAAALGWCAEAVVVSRVSPEVDGSSKKFFKTDFPNDARPNAKELAFGHPYPVVQDSGAYASDFVKDENGDQGQWKAQMEYDTLRGKLRKEKAQAEKALVKKEHEMKELEEAMGEEQKALGAEEEAKGKASKAKADADKAAKDVDDLNGKDLNGKKSGDGHLDHATEQVKKETADLEKCKQELEAAHARLEKLVAEKEDLEKHEAEDAAKALVHHAEAMESAKAEEKKEVQELKDAKAKEAELESEEEHLKKEMEEEKEEHADAKAKFEKEKVKVEQTKADLKAAEEKLRALRGEAPKSLATRPAAALLAVFAAVLCTFAH